MKLNELEVGKSALVRKVGGTGELRQHFLDMGLIPGAQVTIVKYAPMGDPIELMVHSYSLSLRKDEAKKIEITPTVPSQSESTDEEFGYILSLHDHNSHPGLGETGKYHSKEHENPLPKGTVLTFALAGQQNSGKTTLFNRLTGSNQHTGNFPGVTVDRKDGQIKGNADTLVTDLPGIYSLSPYTEEEIVSKNFILDEKPHCLINIVDANNIERNLYLTVQLMELGIPVVLALNMMDEIRNNGGSVRVNEMERILGIPVVPVSAAKGEGIEELVEHAVHIAKYQEAPARNDFCDKEEYGGAVHRCLHSIMHLIEDHAERAGLPARFAAVKLVEGDNDILRRLDLDKNEQEMVEHIILQMEEERGLDRNAAIADMRYSFIFKLCKQTVVKPSESKEHIRSKRIDEVLTGRFSAVPAFIAVIAAIFWLSFDVIGARFQGWIATGISLLSESVQKAFISWEVSESVRSLVIDAIFGGVGTIISFIPIILVLFFFLSLLEDSGYMARIAFVSDKVLRKLGLSGRSIVPMLISFGCSVPGIMASRTLPSKSDRKRTILLIPYMSCSAKIAVYGFLANAFFPGYAGLVMTLLYLLGILIGVIVALASKFIRKEREAAPFVMELPNYRLPGLKNVWHLMWDKIKDFIGRAFSVIFVATVIIWFLQSFDFRFVFVAGGEGSMLARIAGLIAPVFAPIGLGDWRIVTALISGFLAKESIVSTMKVLGATALLSPVSAISMLVFCLLYTPCVAATSSIRRELGRGWAAFIAIFQLVVAWIVSYMAFILAGLII